MSHWGGSSSVRCSTFQSSPAPKGGCHHRPQRPIASQIRVVSILTRPEGRVPFVRRPTLIMAGEGFQSSPAPKGGCHEPLGRLELGEVQHVSILTRPEGRVPYEGLIGGHGGSSWFQSSPAPKGGCHVRNLLEAIDGFLRFQSSPAPKGGCHSLPSGGWEANRSVSILTRPEGRVPCVMGHAGELPY